MADQARSRRELPNRAAKAAALVLFGTVALSTVSAFATAKTTCSHRFGLKAEPLHPGGAVRSTSTGPVRHFIAADKAES
jgi:hypothetical protein